MRSSISASEYIRRNCDHTTNKKLDSNRFPSHLLKFNPKTTLHQIFWTHSGSSQMWIFHGELTLCRVETFTPGNRTKITQSVFISISLIFPGFLISNTLHSYTISKLSTTKRHPLVVLCAYSLLRNSMKKAKSSSLVSYVAWWSKWIVFPSIVRILWDNLDHIRVER